MKKIRTQKMNNSLQKSKEACSAKVSRKQITSYQSMNSQLGVGLIEVLVSLLILAVGVLGYVALQANALQFTDESVQRTDSLVMMRDIGERIRVNPEGIPTYLIEIPKDTNDKPAKGCGLFDTNTDSCTPAELAAAESYIFKEELLSSGYTLNMIPCPSTGGVSKNTSGVYEQNKDNVMFSYCLVAAWGDTEPQAGSRDKPDSSGKMDCIKELSTNADGDAVKGGNYHPGATCMMMELT